MPDEDVNEYEPGATAAQIEAVFGPLRKRLAAFIADIADKGTPPDTAPLGVEIDPDRQHKFGLFVLEAMGFDLNAGRLEQKIWLILAPGFAIFFVVSVLNLVGEGLRDALDPKLRK